MDAGRSLTIDKSSDNPYPFSHHHDEQTPRRRRDAEKVSQARINHYGSATPPTSCCHPKFVLLDLFPVV